MSKWLRFWKRKGATPIERLQDWIVNLWYEFRGCKPIRIPPHIWWLLKSGEWHCIECNNDNRWWLDGVEVSKCQ